LLMTGPSPQATALSAFGRKILRWDIETPSLAQAQAALEMAQNEGRSMPLRQLLQRMDLPLPSHTGQAQAISPSSLAKSNTPLSTAIQQQIQEFHQHGQTALQHTSQQLQTKANRFGINKRGLALGFVTAMVLSMLTLAGMQKDALDLPNLWNKLLHTSAHFPGTQEPVR